MVTAGGADEEPMAEYLNQFLAVTGVFPVGSVWATMSRVEGQDFPPHVRGGAFALGDHLVAAWEREEGSEEHGDVASRFAERMRVLMRKDEWPYEYEYWNRHRSLTESPVP